MTTQETIKDICIDILFDRLAKGEILLADAQCAIREWLEEISCDLHGDTDRPFPDDYVHDMGFIDWTYWAFVYKGGNSNHTKIALLFYKNKFLLEFEIDTPCEVYHEHNANGFICKDIKQFIFEPTGEQIEEAMERSQALIAQYR